MANDRNTFAKRQREVEKKRKADEKRIRRARKKEKADESSVLDDSDDSDDSDESESLMTAADAVAKSDFPKIESEN